MNGGGTFFLSLFGRCYYGQAAFQPEREEVMERVLRSLVGVGGVMVA